MVFDFAEKLKVYFSAAGIIKRPLSEQHQYLRSFLSSQLWALIRDRIHPELPIFMERTQRGYIRGEINSVIELILEEFKMLIFRGNLASKKLQYKIRSTLIDIQWADNVADDVIIYVQNKEFMIRD